jgi:hypothetical protein
MSQVQGLDDGVADTMSTNSFMPMVNRPKAAAEPAAATHKDEGLQSPQAACTPRPTRWPRWPAAWPDGSLPSRSSKAG